MATVKYSGPIASFRCPTNAEIRSLKVHFSPKQEGTGDPSPDNVRPIVGWDGVSVSHSIDIYSVPSDYQRVDYLHIMTNSYFDSGCVPTIAPRIVTKIQIMANTDADLFGFANNTEPSFIVDPANYGFSWYQRWGKTNYTRLDKITIETPTICEFGKQQIFDGEIKYTFPDTNWSSNIQSIRIGGARNINSSMRLYYCDIYDDTILKCRLVPCLRKSDGTLGLYDMVGELFLINQGTGNLECGANVIGEVINYEFGVLGKNKFDQENEVANVYADTNGNLIPYTASSWKASDYIKVSSNTIYTFNPGSNDGSLAKHCYYDKDKNFISYIDSGLQTFTTPNNTEYMRFSYRGSDTPMLELGSTATEYEPYDPNHTVYGGWVDLISGEVCEEWKSITLESLNWSGSGNRARASNSIDLETPSYTIAPDFIAEKYYAASYSTNLTNYPSAIALGGGGFIAYYDGETLPSGKMVYKLPEPITYNLPPYSTALKTFLGQNNVWSNADYVEVEYDLYETQDILTRKQFIIANQPHIETPVAAPLQNFVTDMAAPLKECKVGFKPIQDLHGYDKPWVGGAGKNLFNINAPEQDPSDTTAINTTLRVFEPNTYCVGTSYSNYFYPTKINSYSVSNNTLAVNSDTGYAVGYAIKAAAETTYFISASITNDGRIGVAYYDSTGQWISGEVNKQNKSFTTPANTDIVVLCFNSPSNQTEVSYSNIQLEVGSAATAYEPWENVCPIEGWNNFTLYKTGKNLLDPQAIINSVGNYYTLNEDVVTVKTAYGLGWLGQPAVGYLPAGQYAASVIKTSGENNAFMEIRCDSNGRAWYSWGPPDWPTKTLPENTDYVVRLQGVNNSYKCQIELGNNITEYERYCGTTTQIAFNTDIGTVYGGYVNLVTGEVWKTYYEINITELGTYRTLGINKHNNTQVSWFLVNHLNVPDATAYVAYSRDGYCSCAPFLVNNYYWDSKCQVNNTTADLIIEGELTAEEVDNWIKAHAPIQIVYPLKTPILLATLTPTQLKTLKGINNIWSDANGPIEVKYWTH